MQSNHFEHTENSPKKRVLFVITQSEFGGAQRFYYDLISHLNKEKYEMLLATGKDGASDRFEVANFPKHKLKFLRRNINPYYDFLAIWELKKIILSFKPDILFLNSSKAGFIGSLTTKLLRHYTINPKVIYRIGGWSFNDPRSKAGKWLWIILEKLSAKWKDIIVVNNKHDLDQAKNLKIIPRDKVVLIYNGLDAYKIEVLPKEEARLKLLEKLSHTVGKIFSVPEEQDSPSQAWRQAETIVGTIANLYPSKGLEYLVETSEYFKNKEGVIFCIIGDGPEKEKLENLIKERGLQKKILLLGHIPDAQKMISAFDIFVMPSVKEGFPWAVIEAMAAKLPVIATRVGAVPEIIEDTKNGFLVESARPEQITAKIQELENNERLRQELGIQAHQTVLFKFPLDKMINEAEAIMNNW